MAQSQTSIHLIPQEVITCPNNLQSVLPLPNQNIWMGASTSGLVKFNQVQTQETYPSVFENCSSIDLLDEYIYVGDKVFSLSDNDFLELPIYERVSIYFGGSFNIGIDYNQWLLPQKKLLLQVGYTGPDKTIGAEETYHNSNHQILWFDLVNNSIITQVTTSDEPYQAVAANSEFIVTSTLQETKLWKHNGDLILNHSKPYNHLSMHSQLPLIAAINAQNELQLWTCSEEKWAHSSIDTSVKAQSILFHPSLALLFVLDSKSILKVYDCNNNSPKIILQEELPQKSTLLNVNSNQLYTLSKANQLLIFDIEIK